MRLVVHMVYGGADSTAISCSDVCLCGSARRPFRKGGEESTDFALWGRRESVPVNPATAPCKRRTVKEDQAC